MEVNLVMSTDLKTCSPETTLEQAASMMWQANCGSIAVINDARQPIGIITDRDITMAAMLQHRPLWDIPVASVIADQQLHSCKQNDSVETCLKIMEDYEVRRIPVLDDEGRLCGMMSLGDIVAVSENGHADQALREETLHMLAAVSQHHETPHHEIASVA